MYFEFVCFGSLDFRVLLLLLLLSQKIKPGKITACVYMFE